MKRHARNIMSNKPIYVITAMTDDDDWSKNYRRRSFGYFYEKNAATDAILSNAEEIHSLLFTYAVIEEIHSGFQPEVVSETWFRYHLEERQWKYTEIRPSNFEKTTNFSIG